MIGEADPALAASGASALQAAKSAAVGTSPWAVRVAASQTRRVRAKAITASMSRLILHLLVGRCRASFRVNRSAAPAKCPPGRSGRGTLRRGPRARRAVLRVFHEDTAAFVAAAKPLRGVLKFCPTRFTPHVKILRMLPRKPVPSASI